MSHSGRCLCGAVRYTAEGVEPHFHSCHCNMCRRWSGGPAMAASVASIAFDDDGAIGRYDSSAWAERGFCAKCGSHLFYRLKADERYFVPAGIFDEEKSFVFDHQVFIDEKPPFYTFSNQTHDMTGAELFAKYGSPE